MNSRFLRIVKLSCIVNGHFKSSFFRKKPMSLVPKQSSTTQFQAQVLWFKFLNEYLPRLAPTTILPSVDSLKFKDLVQK
jgi:hypothetical protein